MFTTVLLKIGVLSGLTEILGGGATDEVSVCRRLQRDEMTETANLELGTEWS